MQLDDIEGTNINGLKVLKYLYSETANRHTVYYYQCLCHCGKVVNMRRLFLLKGTVKSCGCIPANRKHGDVGTRFYRTWAAMLSRVKVKSKDYKNYGSRNINVCGRWMIYDNFKHDLYDTYIAHAEKYGIKNTTLDRIDVNGNYCPENCRWATPKEQSNNRRCTIYITYKNETDTLRNLTDKYNLRYKTIWARLYRSKWSVEKAFSKPTIANN